MFYKTNCDVQNKAYLTFHEFFSFPLKSLLLLRCFLNNGILIPTNELLFNGFNLVLYSYLFVLLSPKEYRKSTIASSVRRSRIFFLKFIQVPSKFSSIPARKTLKIKSKKLTLEQFVSFGSSLQC